MISDFFPVLKHLNYTNKDAQFLIQEAKNAINEGLLEKAYELYSQSVNLMLQVTGSMNVEVASSITKMANI